ncbi:MAG: hypothetical protein ABW252_22635, partial [Polyangiales bacterium]
MNPCVRSSRLGFALQLALVLSACAPHASAPPAAVPVAARAAPRRHAVIVTIDGLMPEVYKNPDAHGLRVPTL